MTSLLPQVAGNHWLFQVNEHAACWHCVCVFPTVPRGERQHVAVTGIVSVLPALGPPASLLSPAHRSSALLQRHSTLANTHACMLFASVRSSGWLMTNSSWLTRGWCSFMSGKQWAVMNNLTLVVTEVKLLLSGLVTMWYKTAQQDLSCKVSSALSVLSPTHTP